jgi:DNA repair exonuclease SbcCD nuclease subunit
VKILHTADIHLAKYGDDRWKTLEKLIGIGKQEDVDIFVVSGDLFDKDVDAENLRPKIREIFSNTGFRIVLIPGNHDSESYKGGMYFGADVSILTNLNEPFGHEDLRIWGLPFEPIEGEKILSKLRLLASNLTTDKRNILLYHGELLDAFFSRKDFGDEEDGRYMPVRLSYFKDLNIQYVLAGHFHSKFDAWKLENGGYFVYPGSPISITRAEIGRRKVNIFEVGNPPKEYPLNTPHFDHVSVQLDPSAEKNPVEIVQERFQQVHPEARVLLTVGGYVNGERIGVSEKELAKQLRDMAMPRCAEEPRLEFADVRAILEDDLFKSFMSKLEQRNYDEETKKQLRDLAIKAMMEARA